METLTVLLSLGIVEYCLVVMVVLFRSMGIEVLTSVLVRFCLVDMASPVQKSCVVELSKVLACPSGSCWRPDNLEMSEQTWTALVLHGHCSPRVKGGRVVPPVSVAVSLGSCTEPETPFVAPMVVVN